MRILNDFSTSVRKALSEIDPNYEKLEGLVVCGTHNFHDVEMMIDEIRKARENGTPTLLICAGHQLGAIEYARNILGIKDATSEEFGKGTFVVKKRPTLKVGLHDGETWWSNYEVDVGLEKKYTESIPAVFSSVAFHPEYQSSKDSPHPLLLSYLKQCNTFGRQH